MSAAAITRSSNYNRRKIVDIVMRGMTVLATLVALTPLFFIIIYLFIRGGAGLIAMPDDYSRYDVGTDKLMTLVKDRNNPNYDRSNVAAAVQLEKALHENIQQARANGDTPELQAQRQQIMSDLNTFTTEKYEQSFDKMAVYGLGSYFSFFTESYKPPDQSAGTSLNVANRGGVLHGIIGTFMIVGTSMLIALPIGILAGVFLAEYPSNSVSTAVRFATDVLSAAPSIIVGVTAYVLIVQQTKHFSGIAGSVALSVLMVPVVTRTTEEILKLVPNTVREAAMGLGAPKWWLTFTVVIPTAMGGIVTGALLAFARAAGETAPLLLTILGNNNITFDLLKPMAALPLMTYKYTESPYVSQNELAWTAALVLTMLVLTVNILARWATRSRMK